MPLIPVHNDVFASKAFVMSGSGFAVAGDVAGSGHGGIGKSKKRAIKRIVKKAKPVVKKVTRAALDLAEQFGDDKTKQRAQDARLAGRIVAGAGPCKPALPAAKLRALIRKAKK